ncbi:MAG: hypothetical protein GC191_02930 [Azospirillum sp.]|nr:hypothetical protein [Azospirillum sp.]
MSEFLTEDPKSRGSIDFDFYERQAHHLRAEVVASGLASFGSWIARTGSAVFGPLLARLTAVQHSSETALKAIEGNGGVVDITPVFNDAIGPLKSAEAGQQSDLLAPTGPWIGEKSKAPWATPRSVVETSIH